jgi:hypothetical protein
MLRYFSAIVFLLMGAYVGWFNATHTDAVYLFPGIDVLMPSLAGNRAEQGRVTAWILMGAGGLLFLNAFRRHIRDVRAERED